MVLSIAPSSLCTLKYCRRRIVTFPVFVGIEPSSDLRPTQTSISETSVLFSSISLILPQLVKVVLKLPKFLQLNHRWPLNSTILNSYLKNYDGIQATRKFWSTHTGTRVRFNKSIAASWNGFVTSGCSSY